MQRALAVAQVAIACALLTTAAALLLSFGKLMSVSPGFAVAHRQVASLALNGSAGPILDAAAALPGVTSAALASIAPGTVGGPRTGIRLATEPPAASIEAAKKAFFRVVSPGFMRTAGIRLLRGREFAAYDSAKAARSLIVSRTLAGRYFAGQDVLGRAMVLLFDAQPWTVVGLVEDVHQLGLDKEVYPEMYLPLEQWTFGKLTEMDLLIEAERPVPEADLRRALRRADAAVAIGRIETLDQLVEDSTASRYFLTSVMGGFSLVALLIAVGGLYALIGHSMETRRREIAVRMAVGASRAMIVRMVAREGAVLGATGCGIGLALAVAWRSFRWQVPSWRDAGRSSGVGRSRGIVGSGGGWGFGGAWNAGEPSGRRVRTER